jgi:hypothetical protein
LEAVEQRYLEIQENYFLRTDKDGLEKFLSKRKHDQLADIEMMALENSFILYRYGIQEGEETLSKYGITGSYDSIENKIKQKRTRYNFEIAKRSNEVKKKAENDYYKMIGLASERMGHHIPSDILLPEWCGILMTLKELNGR